MNVISPRDFAGGPGITIAFTSRHRRADGASEQLGLAPACFRWFQRIGRTVAHIPAGAGGASLRETLGRWQSLLRHANIGWA